MTGSMSSTFHPGRGKCQDAKGAGSNGGQQLLFLNMTPSSFALGPGPNKEGGRWNSWSNEA